MIKRLTIRTFVFAVIICLCLGFMEYLTKITGMPEVMQGLTALAKVAAAEFAVLWIRIIAAPKQDLQKLSALIEKAGSECGTQALAILYACYTFMWTARFAAFLFFLEH